MDMGWRKADGGCRTTAIDYTGWKLKYAPGRGSAIRRMTILWPAVRPIPPSAIRLLPSSDLYSQSKDPQGRLFRRFGQCRVRMHRDPDVLGRAAVLERQH